MRTADTRSRTARTSTPQRLQEVVQGHFGEHAEAFPVFNGTGANVTALTSAAAALGCRGHERERAHPHRRGRRPRADDRTQAAAGADPGRQAHPRAHRPRGVGMGRRAPRAAARREHHADHRARHALHARTRCGRSPTTRTQPAWCCTWTARGSRTRRRRSAADCATFTTDAGVDILSFGGTKNGLLVRRGRRGAEP